MLEALLGLLGFLVLAFLRVPMAFAMGVVGFFGVWWKLGLNGASAMIAQITYETGMAYTLSVIPLFILMGAFAERSGLSTDLFRAASQAIILSRLLGVMGNINTNSARASPGKASR